LPPLVLLVVPPLPAVNVLPDEPDDDDPDDDEPLEDEPLEDEPVGFGVKVDEPPPPVVVPPDPLF